MGLACCSGVAAGGEVSEKVLARLQQCASAESGLPRAPKPEDDVSKDECTFSLDTPFSNTGLFVSLTSWQGVGLDFLEFDRERRGEGAKTSLYLHRRLRRFPKPQASDAGDAQQPKRMAVGVEGGFDTDAFEVREELKLAVLPPRTASSAGSAARPPSPMPDFVPLDCPEIPEKILDICNAIAKHEGTSSKEAAAAWDAEQEKRPSKYCKDLKQLPPTRKVSPNPKDWVCEKSGDTQNLWLNLSDGFIGGGRRFFDGSGGSNGALDHYKEEKAKGNFFPLVVKLGTITPHGADVFSYSEDEDDMVIDPYLADHLAHWGIDVMKMQKTDKTMAELEVDLNLSYEWSKICETGERLQKVRGPGLLGLKNLGNSCYLNSTLQMLASIPEFKGRYTDEDLALRKSAGKDAAKDLLAQVAKVANGLLTARYVEGGASVAGVVAGAAGEESLLPELAPVSLRRLAGAGHPEFSSGRQQDAAEFMQHFFDELGKTERPAVGSGRVPAYGGSGGGRGGPSSLATTASLFEFSIEDRFQSGKGEVAYKSRRGENILQLPVRIEDAANRKEVEAAKSSKSGKEGEQPPAPLLNIPIEACLDRMAAKEDGVTFRGRACSKTVRLASMPRYLLVQVQRYYLDEKWIPCKLECQVPMPDHLDLERLRAKGKQQGEKEIPEDSAPSAPSGGAGAAGAGDADAEKVAGLSAMGFTEAQARAALGANGGQADRAAEWLFSQEDLDAAVAQAEAEQRAAAAGGAEQPLEDGPGSYELLGFVSHIGRNTGSGHYVFHGRREAAGGSGWAIFNDDVVARSETPPKDLGYIYLYRRRSA